MDVSFCPSTLYVVMCEDAHQLAFVHLTLLLTVTVAIIYFWHSVFYFLELGAAFLAS